MLPGVYQAVKKDGSIYYRSSITFLNKHISLGSFKTETEASMAYQFAGKILTDSSISLEDFCSVSKDNRILPFKKWVILINYRDNGMYIKTPIYLKKSYFFYYFTYHDYLIFDIDDLFYYNTHSIMRRGGHLFVADYGMQVNILSRYGIKNYSVPNRDFRFINGNTNDFRYENIEIINRFHGVFQKHKTSKKFYETKIHWNGDILVGRYENEIEAAVAYNKAASILITKGYIKDYPVNYIEDIDQKQYLEILKTIKVSPSIQNLKPLL